MIRPIVILNEEYLTIINILITKTLQAVKPMFGANSIKYSICIYMLKRRNYTVTN